MRTAFLVLAIGGFAGLGVLDLLQGNLRLGIAACILAVANGLLLTS